MITLNGFPEQTQKLLQLKVVTTFFFSAACLKIVATEAINLFFTTESQWNFELTVRHTAQF